MHVLIVYAHPEPRSLNGRLRDAGVEALTAAGHFVEMSDLYAMKFNPVADRSDITPPWDSDYFRLQEMQDAGWNEQRFVPEIAEEQEKLLRADLVIFQFPLWWQTVPAILKGWFDRVLARSYAYGLGRYFDTAAMKGKRAMCSVTTGTAAELFTEGAFYQLPLDDILRHVLHGTLAFVGFDVLPSYVAYGAPRLDELASEKVLGAYRDRLKAIEALEPIKF